MKRFFKILLWCLGGLLLVGTFVYLFMNSRGKEQRYELLSPVTGDIERSAILTGKIEPRDEIEIKPQISGIVAEINVEAGDMVTAGDVIAKIKVVPDESQLAAARSRVNSARLALEDARVKYERDRQLYDKKVIAREELENSRLKYDNATEELNAALDAYSIVRDGISTADASSSNTLVRATASGLILDVPVKVGSSVIQANTFNDGTTIATVADMNDLIFRGKVDETEVGSLSVGQKVTVTVGAIPDYRCDAVIEYISPKGTETNGTNTFEIKAAVDPSGASTALRAGYSANATVTLSSARGVQTVPESAITFEGDSTFVYVLTDSVGTQRFERRSVTTGVSDGVNIELLTPLDKGTLLRGALIDE